MYASDILGYLADVLCPVSSRLQEHHLHHTAQTLFFRILPQISSLYIVEGTGF